MEPGTLNGLLKQIHSYRSQVKYARSYLANRYQKKLVGHIYRAIKYIRFSRLRYMGVEMQEKKLR